MLGDAAVEKGPDRGELLDDAGTETGASKGERGGEALREDAAVEDVAMEAALG